MMVMFSTRVLIVVKSKFVCAILLCMLIVLFYCILITNSYLLLPTRYYEGWQEDKLPFKSISSDHRHLIQEKCSTYAVSFPDVSYYSDPEDEREYIEGGLKYYLCNNKDCQYFLLR